jgi:hypothetical protein
MNTNLIYEQINDFSGHILSHNHWRNKITRIFNLFDIRKMVMISR